MLPSAFLESVAIVSLATVLLWPVRAQLREMFRGIGRGYRACFLVGAVLLLAGQWASSGRTTYPFPDWDMYSVSNPDDPRFVDYMAELSSGREERLLMGRLFPAGGRRFRARIDQAAYATERAADGSDDRQADARLNELLAAVTREYNARHPGDQIRVIRLWVSTVPARNYRGPESITRQLLWEYHAQ